MNKKAIQTFAMWAREELLSQVAQRAYQYGITAEGSEEASAAAVNGQALTTEEQQQRRDLLHAIAQKGYDQVMEEVAYTWFNRFIALRFMEVNNYLPSHVRVFSDGSGAFKPEILHDVLHLDLPGLDREKVAQYLEQNQTEALYRYLLLTQCNALNEALPQMFERMGSYTELLFPNNILRPDSVLGHLVADIPEEDWTDQVQIIGWLYQYYNAALKDETFALLKKNVKITKERIPAATQLFTPDWIVRYMVENSLGQLWVREQLSEASGQMSEADRAAREQELAARMGWKYYLPEAEQDPAVRAQLDALEADRPALTDLKLIDPCMGSGHILVYAFDVLMQMYESQGWSQRDAAQSILENNLYGLDIDDRAAQLAYFAVMMKARQYDRRILTRGIQPNLYSPQGYAEGKEYGALLMVEALEDKPERPETITLFDGNYEDKLNAWNFRRLLAQQYDVVVTNPPYMAVSNGNTALNQFVKAHYPDSKGDLFACFMERCEEMARPNGYQAMITQHAWMFLSSYEKLRTKLLQSVDIVNMAHLGPRAFEEIGGEVVQTTSFVLHRTHVEGYQGAYCRLIEPTTQQGKEELFLAGKNRYTAQQANFSKIPGSPVAYWVSENMIRAFCGNLISDVADTCMGMTTGDNGQFLRLWYEVTFEKIKLNAKDSYEAKGSGAKWFPYHKGGEFRRWYGNNEYVVNWENNGTSLRNFPGSTIRNIHYYFHRAITWSLITSSLISFRYRPFGFIFGDAGPAIFPKKANFYVLFGLLNTKIIQNISEIINPTINCSSGVVANFPYLGEILESQEKKIIHIVMDNVKMSNTDWDISETSWDFKRHPLV